MSINLGIIGAGEISRIHLDAIKSIPEITVVAICDVDESIAAKRAEQFGITKYYTDDHDILNDKDIDAVAIVTPTFTHYKLTMAALEAGKHVFCEKPPALTCQEAADMESKAKEAGKLLMYGLVCRFKEEIKFIKEFIAAGRVGDIHCVEVSRIHRCHPIGGWFRLKDKAGGGCMMDAAIHQLDLAMYFLGYPKAKTVRAFATDVNKDLPDIMKDAGTEYVSVNNSHIERTVESFMNGYITFCTGQVMYIKASHISNTPEPTTKIEIMGEKSGIIYDNLNEKIDILTPDRELNYYIKSQPVLENNVNSYAEELRHFAECINTGKECISNSREGTELMRILNALYESADTGKEIIL